MGTYAAELQYGGKRTDISVVANRYMSGESGGICHNNVIPDDAIMCHVSIRHNEIIVADGRPSPSSQCAAVQTDEFPKYVFVSDHQGGWLPFVFKVLRIGPERTVMVEMAPFADRSPTLHAGMGIQNAAGSDYGMGPDSAVGADIGFRGNLARVIDYGCWVN